MFAQPGFAATVVNLARSGSSTVSSFKDAGAPGSRCGCRLQTDWLEIGAPAPDRARCRAAGIRPAVGTCVRRSACTAGAPAVGPIRRAATRPPGTAPRPCLPDVPPIPRRHWYARLQHQMAVRLACTAICAVSRSRISPIMITSGLTQDGAQGAGEIQLDARIDLSLADASRSYSIGSSTVMMLCSLVSSCDSAAYSVVDLPEPVGPVTRIMPSADV